VLHKGGWLDIHILRASIDLRQGAGRAPLPTFVAAQGEGKIALFHIFSRLQILHFVPAVTGGIGLAQHPSVEPIPLQFYPEASEGPTSCGKNTKLRLFPGLFQRSRGL